MLTLANKIKVIEAVDNGMLRRAVATKYEWGRTQINTIILNHNSITEACINWTKASVKYPIPRNMQYPEVDRGVWEFFCLARSKNIPVNGTLIQSEATESAMRHGYPGFATSSGWLESFCAHHQIKMAQLHGESAEVCHDTVEQWLESLPKIIEKYEQRDTFNCDETSIFFHAVPNKSYIGQGQGQSGVKISKDRFSLLVCANAIGEKEELLIIGKAKKPHSFPKYNSDLVQHITYRHDKHGWMTTGIFTDFLNALNNKMNDKIDTF